MTVMAGFNIKDTLVSILGYKGLPYPGVWLPEVNRSGKPDGYKFDGEYLEEKLYTDVGTMLRKVDAQGRYYFMPVFFLYKDKSYEIPNAVISFTGKKTIVETPMVGRKGSVKELINVDDYEISIQAIAQAEDFPEAALTELNEIYNINESITLKCALTDLFLDQDDRVVIKSIDLSDMKGTENFTVFKMELITDRSFELIIE
jgi:hypothetical protein